jgi:putative glycerol-1-phosphate prenyltransferase
MTCYKQIIAPGKKLALLIDPDKQNLQSIIATINAANKAKVSMIFVGGSLMSVNIDTVIATIKTHTPLPVLLFPGSLFQLSSNADALLLLSLVSGRNADYLIGNHVQAAPYLHRSGMEVISTGYILIEGGTVTSVEYVSNTRPIPASKPDLVVATSIASEMLGHKMIYLEAGSGAINSVPPSIVKAVRSNVSVPLIVGGGLTTPEKVDEIFQAGADIIVVGTAIEKNIKSLAQIASVLNNY